jgi:DNA-binding NtrC family response regulator
MLQARRTSNREARENFSRSAVPDSTANRARIAAVFSHQSSLLQNIAGYAPGNFQISVLSEPFSPSPPQALERLNAAEARSALRQCLALLGAAREWHLDFIDFSRFQVLPGGRLRFPWTLERQELPAPAAFIPLFGRNRHLRGLDAGNCRERCRDDAAADGASYLCRREDFACNLLHSRFPASMKASANVTVRIRTQAPWQKAVVGRNLLHNLDDDETLLLEMDLAQTALAEHLSALCGRKPKRSGNPAALVQDFQLFLKKSVYQEAILILDHLQRREDDRLLRYLLESGEIAGLTAVLLDDSVPGECDLEFNEDPPNLLSGHFPCGAEEPRAQGNGSEELLRRMALLAVAVPRPLVSLLVPHGDGAAKLTPAPHGDGAAEPTPAPHGDGAAKLTPAPRGDGAAKLTPAPRGDEAGDSALLAALLKQGRLRENRERGTLEAAVTGVAAAANAAARSELLAWLADRCDWPYARIAHLIAGGRARELEEYLRDQARESPGRIAPGPAADLLAEHLPRFRPQAAPGGRILELGLDILIQGGCLDLASRVIAALPGRLPPWLRLKKAHLALRRREYRELGRLLAGMEPPPADMRDEWLFVSFMHCEKTGQKSKAGELARRIRSPYYRHLSLIQLSDAAIYRRDFARARSQLASALAYFSAVGRPREVIVVRSQKAKLLREEGDLQGAEETYKTIYAEGEAEGAPQNAAAAAVDLGNLYVEADDDFQAERWYQKAARLFAAARDADGLMLVNANLVNVYLAKGEWLESDRLLGALLPWDEEKQLPDSHAVDLLNQAALEALRLHDAEALELAGRAEAVFRRNANLKGIGECAFLRARLAASGDGEGAAAPVARARLSPDQRIVCGLLEREVRPGDGRGEAALFRELGRIRSRKARFEALRLLLRKHRRREWLERFQQLARELSPTEKNYFFYEYWYMAFDLAPEGPPGTQAGEFLAMSDFFTLNRRTMPAKFARMRQQCSEAGQKPSLFDDARLVERSRNWRLPSDFFRSFLHEIGKTAPVEWLAMSVHETRPPSGEPAGSMFRFASSDAFPELGAEMLQQALATPQEQTFDLPEVRRRFRAQEKFFYPFACTKAIRWPIAENHLAGLVAAVRDGGLHFQDFAGRHRETLQKFSALFQNFLVGEYRADEKLQAIVGESEPIRQVKRMIIQVSKVDFSLLITGESGSGKELVANAVHRLSARAGGPFIPVNAAAIPDTLLEAELFGFRKGAFSGASEDRVGLLQAADRGTLFLDEIADLPLPLQAKLLRALQEREVRRLGENRTSRIDVRLISASNKDLGELVRRDLFRADLFYRLQDLQIHIPPLRQRREDIPLLIGSFLERHGYPKLEPGRLSAIAEMFRDEPFPGNVRELESRIKSLITFHPDLEPPAAVERLGVGLRGARQEFEKDLLRRTLAEVGGRRTLAAAKLGISRMALFNLIKKYGIDG